MSLKPAAVGGTNAFLPHPDIPPSLVLPLPPPAQILPCFFLPMICPFLTPSSMLAARIPF